MNCVSDFLPLLAAADKPAFHVVVPSLPGFAFSSAPTVENTGLRAMARIFNDLMHTLGYEQYFAQGELSSCSDHELCIGNGTALSHASSLQGETGVRSW